VSFSDLQTAFQELSSEFFDSFRLSDKVIKKSSYDIRKNNNYDPDKACIPFIRFLSQAVNKGPGPENKRQKKNKSENNENKGINWHFTVSCFGFLLFRSFYYSEFFQPFSIFNIHPIYLNSLVFSFFSFHHSLESNSFLSF